MEAKLKAYRNKRTKEELVKRSKESLNNFIKRMLPNDSPKEESKKQDDVVCDVASETSETASLLDDEEPCCDSNTWAKFTLYGSLWAVLFVLAIHVEFGAVYFIISMLYIIWRNTRTGPKRTGEVSAYSVFNPNCEAIDGTLKAEQLERELLFGGLH